MEFNKKLISSAKKGCPKKCNENIFHSKITYHKLRANENLIY